MKIQKNGSLNESNDLEHKLINKSSCVGIINDMWIWMRMLPYIGMSGISSVETLSKSIYHSLKHPDCWRSPSMTLSFHRYIPMCQQFYQLPIVGLGKNIHHLSVLSTFFIPKIQFLTHLTSLTYTLVLFPLFLRSNPSHLPITHLSLLIGDFLFIVDKDLAILRNWGHHMPYVSTLTLTCEYRGVHCLQILGEYILEGARFLRNLRRVQIKIKYRFDFLKEENKDERWNLLIRSLATYTPFIQSLHIEYCTEEGLSMILNKFMYLSELEVSYGLNGIKRVYVSILDWYKLLDADTFTWTHISLQVDGDGDGTKHHTQDETKSCWIDFAYKNQLHVGIEKSSFLSPVYFKHRSFSHVQSFTLRLFYLNYTSLKSGQIGVLLKYMDHLKKFEIYDNIVSKSNFLILLEACTWLSPSLNVLSLPLSAYDLDKKEFDLGTLFSRFKCLQELRIMPIPGMDNFHYTQRYLSYLPHLKILTFPKIHALSYLHRTQLMEDLPTSIQRLHIGFCLYFFSLLEDKKTVQDWWTSYILALPNLVCMSLPQSISMDEEESARNPSGYFCVIKNICNILQKFKCRTNEKICETMWQCCTTIDHDKVLFICR